jgi:very-short-patch-repair endonuclease
MKILTVYGWIAVKGRKPSRSISYKKIRIKTKAEFAEHLRRNMTPAEKRLWLDLKLIGFLAQQIIRGYIPDFVHPEKKILVEVDGSIHAIRKDQDSQKDDQLSAAGYRVLRFTNSQVLNENRSVLAAIRSALEL